VRFQKRLYLLSFISQVYDSCNARFIRCGDPCVAPSFLSATFSGLNDTDFLTQPVVITLTFSQVRKPADCILVLIIFPLNVYC
jgi:hypothetical protein